MKRELAAAATALALAGMSPAHAGTPTTTITMRATGCDGCTFVAHNGKSVRSAWKVVSESSPVTAGSATLTVPRAITPWMTLEVKHPAGYTEWNAQAFVATRRLTGEMKGYWGICWGKQAGAKARLSVTVTEYRDRIGVNDPKQTFIHARLSKLPRKAWAGVNGTPSCS